ncbi:MAG TPA: hypothetical protein VNZ03_01435 [Terriglobales bacterium]|jgi:hypothetical protein|nr:hypothetical protein [Terriglobales bacterium]
MEKRSKEKGERGHGHWPSLEEQLKAANVIPGSALDKFIRAHQTLHVLRPEEATDRLGLPPWIRVFWRKQHPDGKYFGPSGGYPLVLERLVDWMVAHQDLPGFDPQAGGPNGK